MLSQVFERQRNGGERAAAGPVARNARGASRASQLGALVAEYHEALQDSASTTLHKAGLNGTRTLCCMHTRYNRMHIGGQGLARAGLSFDWDGIHRQSDYFSIN